MKCRKWLGSTTLIALTTLPVAAQDDGRRDAATTAQEAAATNSAKEPATGTAGSPDADPSQEAGLPPLSPEGQSIADSLDRSLTAGSEARAMYDDIMRGRQLGSTDGWFRIAVAQTRFSWDTVKSQYDRDGDGTVTGEEFGGSADDFARLDRDGDGSLTEADLSWKDDALARDPAMSLFRMADADVDGRLTADELAHWLRTIDVDGAGFATLDDLRANAMRQQAAGRKSSGPDRETLLRGLIRQEVGSLQAGPAVGEVAPDFTLATFDGSSKVTLSEVVGPKPVVLVFGNFTCGPFRQQAGNVEKVHRRFRDRANFLMVYVREAHPTDGWHMDSNERVGVSLPQPKSYDERVAVASQCHEHVKFDMPFLVDEIDDRVGATYSGMPSRLYVLDREGKVAYKSGRGPFGFKPAEMEQSLILLLNEDGDEQSVRAARAGG